MKNVKTTPGSILICNLLFFSSVILLDDRKRLEILEYYSCFLWEKKGCYLFLGFN